MRLHLHSFGSTLAGRVNAVIAATTGAWGGGGFEKSYPAWLVIRNPAVPLALFLLAFHFHSPVQLLFLPHLIVRNPRSSSSPLGGCGVEKH